MIDSSRSLDGLTHCHACIRFIAFKKSIKVLEITQTPSDILKLFYIGFMSVEYQSNDDIILKIIQYDKLNVNNDFLTKNSNFGTCDACANFVKEKKNEQKQPTVWHKFTQSNYYSEVMLCMCLVGRFLFWSIYD